MNDEEWTFQANLERGHLPTGEPLEALYGTGWWTEQPPLEEPRPVVQCPKCGGCAYYDLEGVIDCENCGEFPIEEGEEQ